MTINNQAIGGRSVAMFMWTVAKDSAGNELVRRRSGHAEVSAGRVREQDRHVVLGAHQERHQGRRLLADPVRHNDETHTCPRYVAIPDYETYLGFMADTAIAKGATPIFVTPMGHRTVHGNEVQQHLAPLRQRDEGRSGHEEGRGRRPEPAQRRVLRVVGNSFLTTNIFDGGTTHFIKAGAIEMATLIVGEVRKNNGRLASYLK